MNITIEELAKLLKEAERAHAKYEKQLYGKGEDWPEWYAKFIIKRIEKRDYST